jgi:hypothetical protein
MQTLTKGGAFTHPATCMHTSGHPAKMTASAVTLLVVVSVLVSLASSSPASDCRTAIERECNAERNNIVGCSVCAHNIATCKHADVDLVAECRQAVWDAALAAPDPQDPPFDLTRVQFSGVFTSHAVLQRAPQRASLFGTAKPGASVTVSVAGPNGYTFTTPPATVVSDPSDPAVHGTWRVLLEPRPAGLGYTLRAACDGCTNSTGGTNTNELGAWSGAAPQSAACPLARPLHTVPAPSRLSFFCVCCYRTHAS